MRYGPSIPTDSLLAYYDFKNTRCYDGTAGTIYNLVDRVDDLVSVQGNTKPELVYGGISLNYGANTNASIRVSQDVTPNVGPYSFVMTFHQDHRTANQQTLWGNETYQTAGLKININQTAAYYSVSNSAHSPIQDAVSFNSDYIPLENTTVQIAITANSTYYTKVYLNSILVNEKQLFQHAPQADAFTTIGSNRTSGVSCFVGNVYTFMVYTKELNQDEVNQLYEAQKGRY